MAVDDGREEEYSKDKVESVGGGVAGAGDWRRETFRRWNAKGDFGGN